MTDKDLQAQAQRLAPETMERLIVGGDLSKLTPSQRVEVYLARCDAAGLDPRTQPFAYLQLSGKLTLYATKTATDQLVANRRLSVQIVDRRHLADVGLYEAVCRVTHPDGRICEDVGVVTINGLRGDAASNAILKCITKAKRRAVLSACGLGMLDETETDSIPGAIVRPVTIDSGAVPEAQPRPAVSDVRKGLLTMLGNAWKDAGWLPQEATDHLRQATGKDRASALTDQELSAYVQSLRELADQAKDAIQDDDIDQAEFDGDLVPF